MRKYKSKKLIAVIIAYILTVAVLLGLAIYFSTAKYTDIINGKIQIEPSSFNAYILGNNSLAMLKGIQDGTLKKVGSDTEVREIRVFSEEVDIDDLVPGMDSKIIPFSITNGKTTEDASAIPILYSIKIKTTGNIPLSFKLISKEQKTEKVDDQNVPSYNADGSPNCLTKNEYLTCYKYDIEIDNAGDAPIYVYEFYLKGDTAQTPQSFTMAGGKLVVDMYDLEISWPIQTLGVGTTPTNSGKYMKEVDVVEVYVTAIADKNESEHINSKHSTGIIDLYHSNANSTISYTVEDTVGGTSVTISADSFNHIIDFRAFASDAEMTTANKKATYTYDFRITNGNDLLESDNMISDSNTKRTFYTIQVKVPYNKFTEDYSYSMRVRDVNDYDGDNDREEWITLDMVLTELRFYNVVMKKEGYKTYTTVDVNNNNDKKKYQSYMINEHPEAEEEQLFAIYTLYAPGIRNEDVTDKEDPGYYSTVPGASELVTYLTNSNSQSAKIYAATDYLLSVTDVGANWSTELHNNEFALDNLVELFVDCVYSNAETTTVIPHNHKTLKDSNLVVRASEIVTSDIVAEETTAAAGGES